MRFGKVIIIQFGCFQMAVEKKDVYNHMIISSPIVFFTVIFYKPKNQVKNKKKSSRNVCLLRGVHP